MATKPNTPVHLIDKAERVDILDSRLLIEVSSYGAPIRLSMSRHSALRLYYALAGMIDELLVETTECEVIPFQTRRA